MANDVSNKLYQPVKTITIEADFEGQRIDNYLINYLKKIPKSHIYRLLRKGEVRINKGRIKAHYRLKSGDHLRLPPVKLESNNDNDTSSVSNRLIQLVQNQIIFQDKWIIVVNKPSGLAVHGGSGLNYGLIEIIRKLYPQEKHLELVHRLDKDTSGCLLIAKKRSILRELHELFRNNQIDKKYTALLMGKWLGGQQKVSLPLLKNTLKSGERIVRVDNSGKAAISFFKPQKTYANANLVEVTLQTGRTHQIRVHANAIGHPIAGDTKYGNDEFNQLCRTKGLNRLFLHAHSLNFRLSVYSQQMTIKAPLDGNLQHFLNHLDY